VRVEETVDGHYRRCWKVGEAFADESDLRNYSTDISDAFKVLRKVCGRKHWRYELYDTTGTGAEDGSCYCRIFHDRYIQIAAGGIWDPVAEDWEKFGETVAICRAALLTTIV
jgi:hypothetical protein